MAGARGPDPEREIELQHRTKRMRLPDFESDKERSEYMVETEVQLLVSLFLPRSVKLAMLDGELGMAQVPNSDARDKFIERVIESRAGHSL